MRELQPEIFVFGGPNGAGKSTVARSLLPSSLEVSRFVNADFIARGLSPHDPDAVAFEAGRVMLRRIRDLRDQHVSFALESTLASRSLAPFLVDAKAQGFLVQVLYFALSEADVAVSRVRQRVQRGGHDVPEATVRRRFKRSLDNLFGLYLPLADDWSIWDNSGIHPQLVAEGLYGFEGRIFDQERWDELRHDSNR